MVCGREGERGGRCGEREREREREREVVEKVVGENDLVMRTFQINFLSLSLSLSLFLSHLSLFLHRPFSRILSLPFPTLSHPSP